MVDPLLPPPFSPPIAAARHGNLNSCATRRGFIAFHHELLSVSLLLLPFIFYSLVSTSSHSAVATASTYFRLVFRGNALSDLFLTIIFWYFAFFDIRNLRRN